MRLKEGTKIELQRGRDSLDLSDSVRFFRFVGLLDLSDLTDVNFLG